MKSKAQWAGGPFAQSQARQRLLGDRAMDASLVLKAVCRDLLEGSNDTAADLLRREYPFAPEPTGKRNYGPRTATRIFIRDGFIDRYTGRRLIFPPVLRVISMALPVDFPYHKNWKSSATHRAYYELAATIDHLVPASRGGTDEDGNLRTTSMARNSAKLNWSLEQLGWTEYPPGDLREWDGLARRILDYTKVHPEPLQNGSIRTWCNAARAELPNG